MSNSTPAGALTCDHCGKVFTLACGLNSHVHYKHGTPSDLTDQLFNAKWMPEPNSGCWLWTANIGRNGYGQIQIKRRPVPAHRAAWELFKGPIPKGMHVCHRCDTPACVNPDHLFLGTMSDNIKDSYAKGRSKPRGVATRKELRWKGKK